MPYVNIQVTDEGVTTQQKEDRKIYNTHMYGQGNEWHELSAVLTDIERYALIEYLKTL